MENEVYKLVIWCLSIYGFTQIISEASIMEPVRKMFKGIPILHELVNCFLCVSVWVSASMSWFIYSPSHYLWQSYYGFSHILLDAMMASTITWFLHCVEFKLTFTGRNASLEKQSS